MSRPPFLTLPACARARRLPTARGDFAVHEAVPPAGTAPRGTALLVPGYTGSKEDFIALLEPLALAGFRVVAVDGRGQHESGGPREESAYAQAELARDILAQAAAVRAETPRAAPAGPLHLLGHSLGGLIGRAAVLLDPAPFTSLTLMSSGPAAIAPAQQARTRQLVDALRVMDMESVWQAMRESDARAAAGVGNGAAGTPEVADIADAPEVPDATAAFLHRRWMATVPEQLIATGRQLIAEPDRVAELAAVPLPIHVLSGTVDYAWPVAQMEEMAVRLGARRTVIEGAEHSPNAERPQETARALARFWAAAGDGAGA
ncbi:MULTISPECIES: alpha/beta fold hydrolase [Streptomyces]|uniref:Alpha/beta fold hydrolase n=2 Tax=Streptomyces TaxID=1883 RepID=A0A3R7IVG9_9ACTN|nr:MULTISPECIES: alpha/beta fold hydrolase [Streptomyces]KNE81450.1 hydrolase [Streptomyces fradiae]OFA41353.1 hydrolase [Streptomyces fradiae]PQM24160.1 alpha/beta hydrolase [Streptomyces xinghaiensis]RKM97125.1 alpha/beta fold hydrolase [Streptomyces xinghaiensis]RNC75482.1 alpha/beta fold hydrolase [Streptomyces xinghaiensis]